MNDELGRMKKEVVVALFFFRNYPTNCIEKPRKIKKNLREGT
jgi:hypothetical protein